jgi:3-deoxy-7-phosphoheptulonate synthase
MDNTAFSTTYKRDYQPDWPVASEVHRARAALARAAPLVSNSDIHRLRTRLAGPEFLLHAGDCAETFRDNTRPSVLNRVSLLRDMSDVIEAKSGRSTVTVGRIAGQYAKPRSAPVERRGELVLPSYFGDAVNDADFSAGRRTPDPWNLVRAYEQSSRTLSYLESSGVFTSHEALLLDYEQPQTRRDADTGRPYDHSAHLLWVGERTRSLTGPHIAFAAEIANPVAVKIGPRATLADLLALHAVLNPDNTPGRLAFIFRIGRERAYDLIHAMLTSIVAEGLVDRVICDPMHGNTVISPAGVKTRVVADIEEELRAFFSACGDTGVVPGGIHLELCGDDVSECVATRVDDTYLATNYCSVCDPRLNPEQAWYLAQVVGELLAPHRSFSSWLEVTSISAASVGT